MKEGFTIDKDDKLIRKARSIYYTDREWEDVGRFAASMGYKKRGECIRDCSMRLMENPEFQFILDDGPLFHDDMIKQFYRSKLINKLDEVIDLLIKQGISLSNENE